MNDQSKSKEELDYDKLTAGMRRVACAFDPGSKVAIALEMGAAAIVTLVAKQGISNGNAERDAYRAVLEAMGFERLDELPARGLEFCREVGATAKRRILENQITSGSMAEAILAINARGSESHESF